MVTDQDILMQSIKGAIQLIEAGEIRQVILEYDTEPSIDSSDGWVQRHYTGQRRLIVVWQSNA